MSKGLKVGISTMLVRRAVHLGGIHIHTLCCIVEKCDASIHCTNELAIQRILTKKKTMKVLQMIHILFMDEIGQVSSQLMAILDVILRTIRQSNIYVGGLLTIGTLYHRQLPPVNGKLLMASSHIISSFEFIVSQYSVRASGDPDSQRLQNIARMHPRYYEEYPELIDEFKNLKEHA